MQKCRLNIMKYNITISLGLLIRLLLMASAEDLLMAIPETCALDT